MTRAGAVIALRPIYDLRSPVRLILANLGLAATYLLTALLGLVFAMSSGVVTAVWPPAGLALAGLLLFGHRIGYGVWLGSFAANLWGLAGYDSHAGLAVNLCSSMVSATGALAGVWVGAALLQHFGRNRSPLASVRGIFLLLVFGGALSPIISASVGGSVLCVIGHSAWAQFPIIWLTWWAGDATGVMLLTPLLLAWGGKERLRMPASLREGLACTGVLTAVAGYVFLSGPGKFFGGEAQAFLCLPPMIWMSLRLGPRGATAGLMVLAAFAIWGTTHLSGPFNKPTNLNQCLLALNSFLAVSTTVCLCLVAVTWMRRETELALQEANRTLEQRVTVRTQNLQESADHLRDSQQRLALAINAANIGYWDYDPGTDTAHFSARWKAHLGQPETEGVATRETWAQLLHPEDRAATLAAVEDYLQGRTPIYDREFRLRHVDGSYRWIHSIGKFETGVPGQSRRLLGCHIDITDRKHVEMHLRESREQLRLLFETANDAILFVTPHGHILAANQTACRMLQYTEAELRRIGRCGVTDPADERVAFAVQQRNEAGAFRGEMTFVRKDGSQFQGEVATALVSQTAEQRIATVVFRDVTERRQFETEQARALSLLQATIESTHEGLLVVDRNGQVTVHNQRFVEMWQLPAPLQHETEAERVLQHGLDQLEEPMEFLATIRRVKTNPEQESFETLRFKDGRILERYSRPQRSGFEIVGRVWSFRDVTKQRHAEIAVRDRESRLQLALAVAHMGSWDWDLQTNLVTGDERIAALFGGPGTSQLEREADYQKFIHPEDRSRVIAALRQAIERTNYYQAIFRVIWRSGSVRWLEGCGRVLRDETGRALRMVGVTTDITERKHAEESLRQSQNQYAELVNNVDGIVWAAEAKTGAMTFVSSQAERILGYPVAAWTASPSFWQDHLHPQDREQVINFCLERTQLGAPYEFEYRMLAADGRVVWIRDLVKVELENGVPVKLRGILLDVTLGKLASDLAAGQSRALEMIARGAPLARTLDELCQLFVAQLPGARCAILLVDESRNHLDSVATANLPEAFVQTLRGLIVGARAETCGAAAYRRQLVVSPDLSADPLWAQRRELATQHGLRACWATPILDSHQQVIGVCAVYHDHPCEPSMQELRIINSTTNTAAVAILKQQADKQLARSADVLRQLSANLLETQEAERRHLARELHDEIGQTLTATKLLLEGLQQDFKTDHNSGPATKPLQDAIGHVNLLLQQVRALSLSLRPPMLDDFGLRPALRWLLDQHSRTTGNPVTFDAANFTAKPDATLETACFRIAQEALTNIIRHAEARQVNVALHNGSDSFTLVVRDDGRGFDVEAAKARALAGGSLGLLGQQERAALVGGRVEIRSDFGVGTEVRVWFPLTLEPNQQLS